MAPVRVLTVRKWPCGFHSETVDAQGIRVHPDEDLKPKTTTIERNAQENCPVCSNLDVSYDLIATTPMPSAVLDTFESLGIDDDNEVVKTKSSAPGAAPGPPAAGLTPEPAQGSKLNPAASAFKPTKNSNATNLGISTISNTPPPNAPTGPKSQRLSSYSDAVQMPVTAKINKHKAGHPCPDGHPQCHAHHGAIGCHIPWRQCNMARQAISAAFSAGSPWKGAPQSWNMEHEKCVRKQNPSRCDMHQKLYVDMQPKNLK